MKFFLKSVCFLCLCGAVAIGAGCTAKAKLERHVKRADDYYSRGKFEEARIEYLNAFRLNQNDPHVAERLGNSFLDSGDLQRGFQLLSHVKVLQPTNTAVRAKIASLLLMGGEAKKAGEEAEAILKISPMNSEALVLLATSAGNTKEVAATRQRLQVLLVSSPQNAVIHLALGILAQKLGDFEGAEIEFDKSVRFDPKSPQSNFALANICLAQGNTNKAEMYFKVASDAAPVKSVERLGYSEFLIKVGRPAEAKALLHETTAKAPDFMAGWNMLTQIAFSERDTNTASQLIAKALAQDADNRDALLNRARLHVASRDFRTASVELQKLAEAHPRDSQIQHQLAMAQLGNDDSAKALSSLDKAITLNTNNLDAVMLRAQVQISRGDLNSAIPELLRVTRRAPNVPQPHYLLAGAYRQRGAPEDAVAVYTNLARLFPSDPQPYQMIGTMRRQQTNYLAARQSYENALKVNSDFLAAIDDLIELDILDKKHNAALARIQTYIEKYPDKPMPRLLQAKVYFAEQKNSEAEAAVKKAIELDPEFYPAHRALADFYIRTAQTDQAITKLESILQKNSKDLASLLQLGILFESRNDFRRARETYERLLQIQPRSVPTLNNLAYLLSEKFDEGERALSLAQQARELAPYDPYLADTFGWIAFRRGDYARALSVIQQAAEKLTGQPEVTYHLGMAYYMTGAEKEARNALEAAVSSSVEFQGKERAQEALAILRIDPRQPQPGVEATLKNALSRNPADVFAHMRTAQIYESRRDWKSARTSYDSARKLSPKSSEIIAKLAALDIEFLGQSKEGMILAKEAWGLAQDPEMAAMVGRLGLLAGEYEWAIPIMEIAFGAQPNNPSVAYRLGLAYYTQANLARAQQVLDRVSGDPTASPELTKAKALSSLLDVYKRPENVRQAGASVASMLQENADFIPALITSGMIKEAENDFTGAREAYERALQMQPEHILAQRHLALLLAEKLVDDLAASALATRLRLKVPEDPYVARVLGKVAFRRGDYPAAARFLTESTRKLQADGDLLYYLGIAQHHNKETTAKDTLTRAIALQPDGVLSADAKKILAAMR